MNSGSISRVFTYAAALRGWRETETRRRPGFRPFFGGVKSSRGEESRSDCAFLLRVFGATATQDPGNMMGKSSTNLAPVHVGKRVFVIGVGMTKVTGLGRDTWECVSGSRVGLQLPSCVIASGKQSRLLQRVGEVGVGKWEGGRNQFPFLSGTYPLVKKPSISPKRHGPASPSLILQYCTFESTAPVLAVFLSTFRKGFTVAIKIIKIIQWLCG